MVNRQKRIIPDLEFQIERLAKEIEVDMPKRKKRNAQIIAQELIVENNILNPIEIGNIRNKRRPMLRF